MASRLERRDVHPDDDKTVAPSLLDRATEQIERRVVDEPDRRRPAAHQGQCVLRQVEADQSREPGQMAEVLQREFEVDPVRHPGVVSGIKNDEPMLAELAPGAKTFYVQGEVTTHIPKDTARLAGWWCETWGPPATYSWSVSGDTLTLAPVGGNDACGIRGFIWAGEWTRVK
jgi:hypothetical protein